MIENEPTSKFSINKLKADFHLSPEEMDIIQSEYENRKDVLRDSTR
jgi:hypothetical protein